MWNAHQAIVNHSKFNIEAFAMDASFIKKSGSETFGLDKFWNGCVGKAEKGLEASIISLIDVKENASLVLTVDQTEPHPVIRVEGQPKKTRVDFYAEQLEKAAATILQYTKIESLTVFIPSKSLLIKLLT